MIDSMLLEWQENGQYPKYKLVRPLHILDIVIPAGFVSDGASVPRIARGFLSPMGEYAPAAILHDFLLTRVPRKDARYIFAAALDLLEINPVRKRVILSAVFLYDLWKGDSNYGG